MGYEERKSYYYYFVCASKERLLFYLVHWLHIALRFLQRYLPLAISTNIQNPLYIFLLKPSPCLSSFSLGSTGESSSGEESTVFQVKYPASTTEKNTITNLNGHIFFTLWKQESRERRKIYIEESICVGLVKVWEYRRKQGEVEIYIYRFCITSSRKGNAFLNIFSFICLNLLFSFSFSWQKGNLFKYVILIKNYGLYVICCVRSFYLSFDK